MTTTIEALTKSDRTKAELLLKRVDTLLDETRATESLLSKNYIEIGVALKAVEEARAWLVTEHKTFDQYVLSRQSKFGRGRTALYGYKSVAERLLPSMSKEQLIEIGISKAQPLAQHVKNTGKDPSTRLIGDALNPEVSVDQFKAELSEARHEEPDPKGTWFEIGGFYCNPEEKKEILRAFELAAQQTELPENASTWLKTKLVIQALCMEGISSWETDALHKVTFDARAGE